MSAKGRVGGAAQEGRGEGDDHPAATAEDDGDAGLDGEWLRTRTGFILRTCGIGNDEMKNNMKLLTRLYLPNCPAWQVCKN